MKGRVRTGFIAIMMRIAGATAMRTERKLVAMTNSMRAAWLILGRSGVLGRCRATVDCVWHFWRLLSVVERDAGLVYAEAVRKTFVVPLLDDGIDLTPCCFGWLLYHYNNCTRAKQ